MLGIRAASVLTLVIRTIFQQANIWGEEYKKTTNVGVARWGIYLWRGMELRLFISGAQNLIFIP